MILSLVPLIIVMNQSIDSLNSTRKITGNTIETTINEQSIQIYKSNAKNLATRISEFLYSCESDLRQLSILPKTTEMYQKFSLNHFRNITHLNKELPLFKEVTYINEEGIEKVKIVNGKKVSKELLGNVSFPKNTTYRSENYFEETKLSKTGIYVSHVTGWYVSRPEQLELGKSYNGVIRFCKKLVNDKNEFDGICVVTLDHSHLMDFVDFKDLERNSLVDLYKTGSYTYILDDEGWIIAHQKLWDLRGLDRDGNQVQAFSEKTPDWKYKSGIIPINLFYMDWRLKDYNTNEPISSIISRAQKGETILTTMKSMGILGDTEGIVRTRAYSPITYTAHPYDKHGIFGVVAVGTSLKKFHDISNVLLTDIQKIDDTALYNMRLLTIIMSFCVLVFSFFIAKSISKPLKTINKSLNNIAKGDFSTNQIFSPIIEISNLSSGVVNFSKQLNENDKKIKHYVSDLELVNKKLSNMKKELGVFLQQDYEVESDTILEEKIAYYENEYPKLREIRNSICIGKSHEFLRVLRQLVPQSQMTMPTWIYGESGVGKSALANTIHILSPRRDNIFRVFTASEFASADPIIVMGKLFGYGAGHGITGIDKNGQSGIIESCDGGTLLIDDIDSLPLESQAHLLRVLDGLPFHPAAGKATNISADVRFLFASHIDLKKLVAEGSFRKDLFRRMGANFNKMEIPPLRNRPSDIILLAEFFISKYCKTNKLSLTISDKAKNLLNSHDYRDGNIGELRVLIEFACEMSKMEHVDVLTEKHFPALNSKKREVNFPLIENRESVFNSNELIKLDSLRNNNFRMDITEEQLGFMRNSRTLSNYFKGICLKALLSSNYQLNDAVKLITKSENDNLNASIEKRFLGYISNIIQKINDEKTKALFNNLPKEYHTTLNSLIEYYKSIN